MTENIEKALILCEEIADELKSSHPEVYRNIAELNEEEGLTLKVLGTIAEYDVNKYLEECRELCEENSEEEVLKNAHFNYTVDEAGLNLSISYGDDTSEIKRGYDIGDFLSDEISCLQGIEDEKEAYEDYKEEWIADHIDSVTMTATEALYENTDEAKDMTFEEYVEEYGFADGSCYASFEEYRNGEGWEEENGDCEYSSEEEEYEYE